LSTTEKVSPVMAESILAISLQGSTAGPGGIRQSKAEGTPSAFPEDESEAGASSAPKAVFSAQSELQQSKAESVWSKTDSFQSKWNPFGANRMRHARNHIFFSLTVHIICATIREA
jgi:hypothetical protein